MSHEPEAPTSLEAHHKGKTMASDAILRRWVTWFGVIGTVALGAFFFGFIILQTIGGEPEPNNWVIKLTHSNYAALVGTPMSAVAAFCIVSLLKVTNGPIEFEVLGFKFRGASGPIVLWVVCFLAIVVAFRLLWDMAPNPSPQQAAPQVTATIIRT